MPAVATQVAVAPLPSAFPPQRDPCQGWRFAYSAPVRLTGLRFAAQIASRPSAVPGNSASAQRSTARRAALEQCMDGARYGKGPLVASPSGGSRTLPQESRRRRVHCKPRVPAPRRRDFPETGEMVQGGEFYLELPFQESRLLSRKAGSFPGKLAPFRESRLLSRKAGSFPGKLAPFAGSWLLSLEAGFFRWKLASFAGSWLLSLEAASFRWKLASFAGSCLLSLEAASFRWKLPLFAGSCLLSLEAAFFRGKPAPSAASAAEVIGEPS
jgi:hypothetical protein